MYNFAMVFKMSMTVSETQYKQFTKYLLCISMI